MLSLTRINTLLGSVCLVCALAACRPSTMPVTQDPAAVQQATPSMVVTLPDSPPNTLEPAGLSPSAEPQPPGLEPVLLNELVSGCEKAGRGQSGPREGEPAIDFTLETVTGERHHLGSLLREKPVVLIFGSFT
jgi:hypothetical protein